MAYIDYKQLKAELPFTAVLSHYGLAHHPDRAQDYIACPFHEDDKPSCSINHDKRIFQCFGCKRSGNVLHFVCFMENLDPENPEELKQGATIAVRDILGREASEFSNQEKKGKGAKPSHGSGKHTATKARQTQVEGTDRPPKATPKNNTDEDNSQVTVNKPLGFELQNLQPDHPVFTERGVSQEAINTFGLGFYDQRGMMKGRIVFPIQNASGKLVAYAGRWHDDNPPEGEGKYKLPPGFNKSLELYNQHRAKAVLKAQDWAQALVIVEGFWSAIRLHQAGFAVVASFGHDLSVAQAKAIAQLTNDAVIVYDGDEPGRAGAERSAGLLSQHVFTRTLILEDGIKPDVMDLDLIRAIVT